MNKRLFLGLTLMLSLLLPSCKKSDGVTLPTYSNIELVPAKEVYTLGESVQCRIQLLTPGSDNLKKATYWFYANWWFTDPDLTADFQEFNQDVATGQMWALSSSIQLTQPTVEKTKENGHADLIFYGRLEYPNWDFRKVEIRVPIKVVAE